MPYYGYARQDRKVAPRTPITAKLIADLLEVAGATRVVSMDMHAGQIQGFFNIPSDHLYGSPVFLEDLKRSSPSPTRWSSSRRTRAAWSARAYSKRINQGSRSSTSAAPAPTPPR